MQRHGWTLLFHEGVIEQLRKLQVAAERAEQNDPQGFKASRTTPASSCFGS